MSNPTTPFGWQMPQNTDLVTDLPADFEVFGQAVATDLQYLLGGTTGQVLKKDSNTDLDFVWAADAAGMTNPMTTTGDVIYSSPGSTPVRLGIGSTGNILTVAGGVPTWAAPAGGGKVLQVVSASTSTSATSTSTTYADTNLTCNITPTLNTSKVLVLISQICVWSRNDASGGMGLKIMRGATTVYEPDNNAGTVASSNHEVLGNPKASEQKLVQTFNYLDSPATTSATTYKTQFRVYDSGAGGSATCQYSSTTSVITLLEIGA